MAMSTGFRVYEKSKPPSPKSILLEHRNHSDSLLFESQTVAVLSRQETEAIRKQYTKIYDAYGCVGVIGNGNDVLTPSAYLILVTGCFSVGKLDDVEIFRITQTQLVPLQYQPTSSGSGSGSGSGGDTDANNELRRLLNSGIYYFAWNPNTNQPTKVEDDGEEEEQQQEEEWDEDEDDEEAEVEDEAEEAEEEEAEAEYEEEEEAEAEAEDEEAGDGDFKQKNRRRGRRRRRLRWWRRHQRPPFDITLCAQRRFNHPTVIDSIDQSQSGRNMMRLNRRRRLAHNASLNSPNSRDNTLFFWNIILHVYFLKYGIDTKSWLLKLICGSVVIRTVYAGSQQARIGIISRLSCPRTIFNRRMRTRGVNDDGGVTNFIETEQVIYYDNQCTSYVQVRGSVPIFWEQPGVQSGSHKVKLSRGFEASTPAFDRHMKFMKFAYSEFSIVNLLGSSVIGNKEGEAMLSMEFQRHHNELTEHSDVPHILFDYHQECRVGNTSPLTHKLLARLEQSGSMDYNVFYLNNNNNNNNNSQTTVNNKMQHQKGVIRTNCLDCLERTNAVQTFIGMDIFYCKQIQLLGLCEKKQMASRFEEIFRQMWQIHSNDIAKIYTVIGLPYINTGGGGGGGGGGGATSAHLNFGINNNQSGASSSSSSGTNSNSNSGSSSSRKNKLLDGARSAARTFQTNTLVNNLKQESMGNRMMWGSGNKSTELLDRARQLLPLNMLHTSNDVLREMTNRYREYCLAKVMRIACGTYNVNGGKHFRSVAYKDVSLADWLLDWTRSTKTTLIDISPDDEEEDDDDDDDEDYRNNRDDCDYNPNDINNNNNNRNRNKTRNKKGGSHRKPIDVYAIGFQEIIDLNATNVILQGNRTTTGNASASSTPTTTSSSSSSGSSAGSSASGMGAQADNAKLWLNELQKIISRDRPYYLLTYQQLVGVCLYIFVRAELLPMCRDIGVDYVKTGFGGTTGNKGAVAIRFQLFNTTFCFVCAHFAAGQNQVSERNADYNEITRKIQFPGGRSLRSHEYAFWLGDFNYRIDGLPLAELKAHIKNEEFRHCFRYDQLRQQMENGLVFTEFVEGPIEFAPTYKYDLFSADYDTSEKCRLPAWTDRVLWRRRKPPFSAVAAPGQGDSVTAGDLTEPTANHGKLIHYGRCELKQSDHRPVIAIVDCPIYECDERARLNVFKQIIMELGPPDATIVISIDKQKKAKGNQFGGMDGGGGGGNDDGEDEDEDEDDDDDEENSSNSIYNENLMAALIQELTQIGEIILVRYVDDDKMLITFRYGQSALAAYGKRSVKICDIPLKIHLKTPNWLEHIENEIDLCTLNITKLYDMEFKKSQSQCQSQRNPQGATNRGIVESTTTGIIAQIESMQFLADDYNSLGIPNSMQNLAEFQQFARSANQQQSQQSQQSQSQLIHLQSIRDTKNCHQQRMQQPFPLITGDQTIQKSSISMGGADAAASSPESRNYEEIPAAIYEEIIDDCLLSMESKMVNKWLAPTLIPITANSGAAASPIPAQSIPLQQMPPAMPPPPLPPLIQQQQQQQQQQQHHHSLIAHYDLDVMGNMETIVKSSQSPPPPPLPLRRRIGNLPNNNNNNSGEQTTTTPTTTMTPMQPPLLFALHPPSSLSAPSPPPPVPTRTGLLPPPLPARTKNNM